MVRVASSNLVSRSRFQLQKDEPLSSFFFMPVARQTYLHIVLAICCLSASLFMQLHGCFFFASGDLFNCPVDYVQHSYLLLTFICAYEFHKRSWSLFMIFRHLYAVLRANRATTVLELCFFWSTVGLEVLECWSCVAFETFSALWLCIGLKAIVYRHFLSQGLENLLQIPHLYTVRVNNLETFRFFSVFTT